jgi:hypothetical protein
MIGADDDPSRRTNSLVKSYTCCHSDGGQISVLIHKQVRTVFGKRPAAPGETINPDGTRRLSIITTPLNGPTGRLESMCAAAARAVDNPAAGHVDTFKAISHVDGWVNPLRQDEMWLRSNLAIRVEADPAIPLGYIFGAHPAIIPITGAVFQPHVSRPELNGGLATLHGSKYGSMRGRKALCYRLTILSTH